MSDEPKPIPCPTCGCPGFPARAEDGGALFAHFGRDYPCRVTDPSRIQAYRALAVYQAGTWS